MSYIVFERPGGGVSVIVPAPGRAAADCIGSVPEGAPYSTVENLPERGERDKWALRGGAVVIDAGRRGAVPAKVSKLQLVKELRVRGLWGRFKQQLSADAIKAEDWDLANYIERAHPDTPQMGAAFGLDSAGLDDLFREAAKR